MLTDTLHHVVHRPPVRDWDAVSAGADAIFATIDALPLPPAGTRRHLRELWTYRLRAADVEALLADARPVRLSIHGMHTPDLGFLAAQPQLDALAIDWNNKLRALEALAALTGLTVLSLQDLRHVRDLSPLARLTGLRGLNVSGGIDTKFAMDTLDPLAGLPQLEELMLASVRIGDGRLDALAALPALKRLEIANNAASFEEFARLAARRPDIACDKLRPYVQLDGTPPPGVDPAVALDMIGDARVMVVGKHGPFLRARADRDRLLRYCERFEALKAAA